MLDTQSEQVLCLACHKPVEQRHGKRARLYCNDVCKTAYHRQKAREAQQAALIEGYSPELQQVLADVQVHSMELAQRVASAINAGGSQHVEVYQEKLAACASRIEKLERQVEVQRQRLGQYYQRSAESLRAQEELEQEVTRYRDLLNHAKLEGRFMLAGERVQYRALLMLGVFGGVNSWQSFMERADDETLIRAIAAAEVCLDNLTVPRSFRA